MGSDTKGKLLLQIYFQRFGQVLEYFIKRLAESGILKRADSFPKYIFLFLGYRSTQIPTLPSGCAWRIQQA